MESGITTDAAPKRAPRKGERLEVEIDSLAFGGRGIARADGFVVFVSGGLPGDRVLAEVTKGKKRFAEARTVELLRALAVSDLDRRVRCEQFRSDAFRNAADVGCADLDGWPLRGERRRGGDEHRHGRSENQ